MASSPTRNFHFSIDRGGTFTDVFAVVPNGSGGFKHRALKLLSEDPGNYQDAPREGIRRILEQETGTPHPRNAPLDTSRIASIRMGTTVATNALLERKGERSALVATKGFGDLLYIGNQSRPNIFDLEIRCPDTLYEVVVEVDEQVILPLGDEPSARNGKAAADNSRLYPPGGPLATGVTGEVVCVRKKPDMEALQGQLKAVYDSGIRAVAVVLKHAAVYPEHERMVGSLAKELGFTQVSLSHEVMPMVKMVPRGFTAAADAYLTPHIMRYIQTFQSGFDAGLKDVQVLFMQSDGGLCRADAFSGHKAVLSGPAGGVVGAALTTGWEDHPAGSMQIIGFDMGGTSTDVSRYAGTYEHVFETTTAGVTIQAPQLDVNTVAAGGGSRLMFRGGLFVVGPESVGAHPGPVCYKKGGQPAITDANVVLGRIVPQFFPQIFGPNEDEPLDVQGAVKALQELTDEVNSHATANDKPPKTADEVAAGFITVANEAMCRPIRALTQMKGYDASAHVLTCFGGAGGQHACAIAQALGMKTIFIHKYAGILSAVGIALADVVQEAQEPVAAIWGAGPEVTQDLEARLDRLQASTHAALKQQGFTDSEIGVERFLNMRYQGTDVAVMTACPSDGDYAAAFAQAYQREFGFSLDRPIVVDDVRVRGTGKGAKVAGDDASAQSTTAAAELPPPCTQQSAYFVSTGRVDTPVHQLNDLPVGARVPGPAILIDHISTIVVEPSCTALITQGHNVCITVGESATANGTGNGTAAGTDVAAVLEGDGAPAAVPADPIQLAIFSHRFMGIAEQMGRTLQRTSISVNIKERLDFSCALFGPDGSLVANAPHLPVHLGAMSEAVRFQVRYYGPGGPGEAEGLHEGDVLCSNHPQLAGGSHLPDITVITPVFQDGHIVFFVASRGHHADIGGISPGSMPPNSKLLVEEGAAIVSFKLVKKGRFQEEALIDLLMAPGKLPGCSGTRNLSDNLSDLKAQVAANQRGIQLVGALIAEHSLSTVVAYMHHIQANAEGAVRDMLREFSLQQGLPEVGTVHSEDVMDDGSPIRLAITIDRRDGSAVFDFEGTGPEVYANHNAPPAVAYSAIIYSLRCLVQRDIPLNQGCLAPVTVKIPPACLLNPSPEAAVVGGNVLTSQRVTDVVLRAFKAAAASQGCMNNFTMGDEGMGYYETIAGGAGAGPGWHGRSGVHTHMTNTRITDPEILERRYPVVLHRFELRKGSGGDGRFRGGDGVVREIEALRPLTAGILSERRATCPFGLLGGHPGAPGLNLLTRAASARTVNLGGKATVQLQANDVLTIMTPGAGGFGAPSLQSSQGDGQVVDTMRNAVPEQSGDDAPAAVHSSTVRATQLHMPRGSAHDYQAAQESA